MNQDEIFKSKEGDNWFNRNKESLGTNDKIDWPSYLIDTFKLGGTFKTLMELGCANGWRLQKIARKYKLSSDNVMGVEASSAAIQDAKTRYPSLRIEQGLLSKIPSDKKFDLVIVNFVYHWVDRASLSQSIAETDRVIADGGVLILGDFLPDFAQKRFYHHLPEEKVFTFKQDYAKIFESLGTYKEFARVTYNHDKPSYDVDTAESGNRGVCVALRKSLTNYYPEIK